jgi:triphosphoribosyl-dephospho-CoA synthase
MTGTEPGDGTVDDETGVPESPQIPDERSPLENVQLALLLEVATTPTPGCVDREREYPDLRFEHFVAGAVGARPGLAMATAGEPLGAAFERAVRGMSRQTGGNTQFGALLLVLPLLAAAARGDCTPAGVRDVVSSTTVEDAAHFYRAFEHVDVFVDDPPDGADDLDVRRGADAIGAVRERGVTLADVLALGAESDDDAREWTEGFPRSFRLAEWLSSPGALPGQTRWDDPTAVPLTDRAARAFLAALAERPDTLVAKKHGLETAERVRDRAGELQGAERSAVTEWAEELVASGINPGTTADVLAAGLFIALEREWVDV